MHYEKKSKIKFCNYIAKSKAQTYQKNAYKKKTNYHTHDWVQKKKKQTLLQQP